MVVKGSISAWLQVCGVPLSFSAWILERTIGSTWQASWGGALKYWVSRAWGQQTGALSLFSHLPITIGVMWLKVSQKLPGLQQKCLKWILGHLSWFYQLQLSWLIEFFQPLTLWILECFPFKSFPCQQACLLSSCFLCEGMCMIMYAFTLVWVYVCMCVWVCACMCLEPKRLGMSVKIFLYKVFFYSSV